MRRTMPLPARLPAVGSTSASCRPRADQVTGGDARLHILVPRTVPLHQVEVWVNGVDQLSHFA